MNPAFAPQPSHDRRGGVRLLLLLDLGLLLTVWCWAALLSTVLTARSGLPPSQLPTQFDPLALVRWAGTLALWLVLFNVLYLLGLLLLRMLLPSPREGAYATRGRLDGRLLVCLFISVLTNARLRPPFPGFLVHHLANLPPLAWLVQRIAGPRSGSAFFTAPTILDPDLVEIGRNVVIGYGAILSAHTQTHERYEVKRTVIEDDVVIGGNAILFAGVRIGRGAMIGAGAVVPPDTRIGAGEFWAGVPARKVAGSNPKTPLRSGAKQS